jgi:alpha-ketoglutarate-dependent taurine dioxygenase
MKVSKIPGLGRFGVFIDDLDLNNVEDEQWMEIGQMHLEHLVTIIRGNNIDYKRYYELMRKWGTPRYNRALYYYDKYGKSLRELIRNNLLDDEDKKIIDMTTKWGLNDECPGLARVTGRKDKEGNPIGVFGGGELVWHQNESGDIAFTPGVCLMGYENMENSATGFCTSTDWYEEQTESFRSELDDMKLIHNYTNDYVERNALLGEQRGVYTNNAVPIKDQEIPLIIQNPIGIRGLHIGYLTYDKIEGMSKEDSDKFFAKLKSEMMSEKYTYHHWYKNDRDLLIFDNSITLHNRSVDPEVGESPERLALRMQFDYDKLVDNYNPYFQDEYNALRKQRIDLLPTARGSVY